MGGIIRLKNAVKEFNDGKDKKIRALDIDESGMHVLTS